jgi:pilus assembly protein Flp/PilA
MHFRCFSERPVAFPNARCDTSNDCLLTGDLRPIVVGQPQGLDLLYCAANVNFHPGRYPIMASLLKSVRRFLADESGPTAMEYAFLAALIICVCLLGINAVGTATSASFQNSANSIGKAGS